MISVPTLPKETAYLYARFNEIEKISTSDFADIGKFSIISLTLTYQQLEQRTAW